MYLLDTNACLDFLLARQPRLVPRVQRAFADLAVSMITAAELRVGNRRSERPEEDARQIEIFLSSVQVPAFDTSAATAYGAIGRVVGVLRISFDRLIAAHALALGATLITNNEKHFADVPGLLIENWTL